MRPQSEMLEHHADAGSDLRQLAIAHYNAGAADTDLLTVQIDLTGIGPFEPVDTAQQRRLAGPGRAEHAHRFALVDLETDIGQHLDVAEGFDTPATSRTLLASAIASRPIAARLRRGRSR